MIEVQFVNYLEITHPLLATRSLRHSTPDHLRLHLWRLFVPPVSCELARLASRFIEADLSSMGTVKGDSAQSAPPDAIPQSGVASSRPAQATTSIIAPASMSAVVSAASTGSSTVKTSTSAQRASRSAVASASKPTSIKASTDTSVESAPGSAMAPTSTVPGGGAVLIGDSSMSDAADSSASATASEAESTPVASSPVSVSVANDPSAAVPSAPMTGPASPVGVTRPVKGCGRSRSRRPHRGPHGAAI